MSFLSIDSESGCMMCIIFSMMSCRRSDLDTDSIPKPKSATSPFEVDVKSAEAWPDLYVARIVL